MTGAPFSFGSDIIYKCNKLNHNLSGFTRIAPIIGAGFHA
jgi:hypothetical protein